MKLFLLTKANWDWNEPLGVFETADDARKAIAEKCSVEWCGTDADGIEYPTIDRAQVPYSSFDSFLIREMELGVFFYRYPQLLGSELEDTDAR